MNKRIELNIGIKEYIKHKKGPMLLKLKLNMTDLKANFKGKYDNISCRRCGLHEENEKNIYGNAKNSKDTFQEWNKF